MVHLYFLLYDLTKNGKFQFFNFRFFLEERYDQEIKLI